MAGIFAWRTLVLCACMLYFYTEVENEGFFIEFVYVWKIHS